MKKSVLLLSALLITSLVEAGQPSPQVMTARTTIKAFGGQLNKYLKFIGLLFIRLQQGLFLQLTKMKQNQFLQAACEFL